MRSRDRIAEALLEYAPFFPNCKTITCILRELTGQNSTMMNCSYRYSSKDAITGIAIWIDGPCTALAALLALIGARFAFRFLYKAGLNKDLTAALFSLCMIDSLLMITVFSFYCVEAIGMLTTGTNIMYNHQAFSVMLNGVAQSLTTSSVPDVSSSNPLQTMLVIYVAVLRCLVVLRPLKYAHNHSHNRLKSANSISQGRNSATPGNKEEFLPLHPSVRRSKHPIEIRKILKPFFLPFLVILACFVINTPVYFEFTLEKCFDVEHGEEASCPAATTFRHTYTSYKAVLMTLTQTIGPVASILVLTLLTEYHVHRSLKARRKLFESQQRSRSVVLSEELKERVSRTVAIFIAVKFLILRSMPVFFDVYENLYGIEYFGVTLSILVRVSDFMIVLNSATNSLAYFGKKRWLEKRLRLHLLKKEEKRQQKANSGRRHNSYASSYLNSEASQIPISANEEGPNSV